MEKDRKEKKKEKPGGFEQKLPRVVPFPLFLRPSDAMAAPARPAPPRCRTPRVYKENRTAPSLPSLSLGPSLSRCPAKTPNTETLVNGAAVDCHRLPSPLTHRRGGKLRRDVSYHSAEPCFLGYPRRVAIVGFLSRHRPSFFLDSGRLELPPTSATTQTSAW